VWTGLIWLRIGARGRALVDTVLNFSDSKKGGKCLDWLSDYQLFAVSRVLCPSIAADRLEYRVKGFSGFSRAQRFATQLKEVSRTLSLPIHAIRNCDPLKGGRSQQIGKINIALATWKKHSRNTLETHLFVVFFFCRRPCSPVNRFYLVTM
jgi:hypothetical protein